jgi:hypothetical protein
MLEPDEEDEPSLAERLGITEEDLREAGILCPGPGSP